MDTEIVIVGAGAAGLAAAQWLAERSIPVIVLEGRDAPGGRVMWRTVGSVDVPAELGAEFIHGDAPDRAATEDGTAGIESGYGETVLVVDDEATVRMLIVDLLQDAGYRVIEAADGPGSLKFLQSDTRIDLLVTDVGLPGGMNGRQVADAGRALRPELKVLFITGYAENAIIGNGHLEPGMQVITKPFAIDALANRVRDMIDG